MPSPPAIFVSYARVNDAGRELPDGTVEKGWVTQLVEDLLRLILPRAGCRRADIHLELDVGSFDADIPIPNEIDRAIERASIFLLVASKNYFRSQWCRGEMEQAARIMQNSAGRKFHVYVVDYLRIEDRGQFTSPLHSLSGFQFWHTTSDDITERCIETVDPINNRKAYDAQVLKLATQIAARLEPLLNAPAIPMAGPAMARAAAVAVSAILTVGGANPAAAAVAGNAVGAAVTAGPVAGTLAAPADAAPRQNAAVIVVASVPADERLRSKREQLIAWLENAGFLVKPAESFPPEPAALALAMQQVLAGPRALYIHLLSNVDSSVVEGQGATWGQWQAGTVQDPKRALMWAEDAVSDSMMADFKRFFDEGVVWGRSGPVRPELDFTAFLNAVFDAADALENAPDVPVPPPVPPVLVTFLPADQALAAPLEAALTALPGTAVRQLPIQGLAEFEKEVRASRRVIYLRGPGSLRLLRCQLEMAARCLPPDGRLAVLDPAMPGRPGMETDSTLAALLVQRGITVLRTADPQGLQGFLA